MEFADYWRQSLEAFTGTVDPEVAEDRAKTDIYSLIRADLDRNIMGSLDFSPYPSQLLPFFTGTANPEIAEGRANLRTALFHLGRELSGLPGYHMHSREHVWSVTEFLSDPGRYYPEACSGV